MMEVGHKIALKIDHQVVGQLPNGNYRVEVFFKRFSIEMKLNSKVLRYDSDTVDVSNPLYKTLNFLTDVKLKYEVTPDGVVGKLVGFEPIKKQIEKDPRLGNLLLNVGSERFILELYNYIPKREVEAGEKWKSSIVLPDINDLKCDVQYSLKEVAPKSIKINQDASFQISYDLPDTPAGKMAKVTQNGTQSGTLVIDSKTNMRVSSLVTQSVTLLLVSKNDSQAEESVKKLNIVVKTAFELTGK